MTVTSLRRLHLLSRSIARPPTLTLHPTPPWGSVFTKEMWNDKKNNAVKADKRNLNFILKDYGSMMKRSEGIGTNASFHEVVSKLEGHIISSSIWYSYQQASYCQFFQKPQATFRSCICWDPIRFQTPWLPMTSTMICMCSEREVENWHDASAVHGSPNACNIDWNTDMIDRLTRSSGRNGRRVC